MTYSMAWLATAGAPLAAMLFVLQVLGLGYVIPTHIDTGLFISLIAVALWATAVSPLKRTPNPASYKDTWLGNALDSSQGTLTEGLGWKRRSILGVLAAVAAGAVVLFLCFNDGPDGPMRSGRYSEAERLSNPRLYRYYGLSLNDCLTGHRASTNEEHQLSYHKALGELFSLLAALAFTTCAIILHFRAPEIMKELVEIERRKLR